MRLHSYLPYLRGSAALMAITTLTIDSFPRDVAAQTPEGPVAVSIKGRVLDDENQVIPGNPVKVTVMVGPEKTVITYTKPDGTFEVPAITLKKKQRIDNVKFEHPRQHPQFVTLLSGVDPVEVINKLMNAPPGPEDYESIFNQLLVYEGLYYATAVPGKQDGEELTRYRMGLSQMAGPGSKIYDEMGQDARLGYLIKKRAEVFQLYGLNPDDQSIPGLALCARCALHMTAQCNAALVADTGDVPSVWLLADGREPSPAHEIVCKTTVPATVSGKVIKASALDASGQVVAGIIDRTKIVVDKARSFPENDRLVGSAWCESCDYKKGNICQNVVVCHVGGKNILYDLEPNDVSNPLHLRGKPVMVYGTTSRDTSADGTRHNFVATKVTLIGLSPSAPK